MISQRIKTIKLTVQTGIQHGSIMKIHTENIWEKTSERPGKCTMKITRTQSINRPSFDLCKRKFGLGDVD
jgi:hypothetical protein